MANTRLIQTVDYNIKPFWFSALNTVWQSSYPLGTKIKLEKDSLIKSARTNTGLNDLGKDFRINKETDIVVKKDSMTCGSIKIIPGKNISIKNAARNDQIAYLIVMINNQKFALSPEEHQYVKKGDILFDVETEKAILEVESKYDGVVKEIIE